MADRYNPHAIEQKWQEQWEADELYRSVIDTSKPKYYALTMLPYPTGDLHIGHWYAMTPSDARARYMRMNGYNVLFPMGFDAFGLPAENAAIKRRHPPQDVDVRQHRAHARRSCARMGAMFDWEREAVSCRPGILQWTEWFFIAVLQARAGLPEDVAGGLVPELQHDAGARAGLGRRPPLRALRHARHQEEPGSVVLPHHQVRRRTAELRRHRLARARARRCRPTGSAAAKARA